MTTPNRCQFWDCDEIIRRDYFLCSRHFPAYRDGTIDECSQCGQYKDAEYEVCRKCYRQPAAAARGGSSVVAPPGGSSDAALLEELRDLRRNLARTHRLQDFMVFSNDTLEQMEAVRPTTAEEMLTITGVGPVKMERFGWDFLRVIRPYSNQPQTPVQTAGTRTVRQTTAATNRPQAPEQVAEPSTNDPRQRWPAPYRTSDGHYVRSRAEAMIDDWLYNHRIVHAYERKLPVADVLSDFYLPQGNVYIEFWGKENDSDYVRRMHEKQEIYRRNNLQLISLTDAELYRLDDHLPQLLLKHGISIA